LMICASFLAGKAQFAFNEVYARPGNGQAEFIEIYNNAKTNIFINLDCYSALTYWRNSVNERGWYVLDFGPSNIAPGSYYVAAAASPFNTQNQTGVVANLDWNNLPAGASLTKWQYDGVGGYTQVPITLPLTNFIEDVNSLDAKNTILLYKSGVFEQGLVGSSNSNILDGEISSLPSLTVPTLGACTSQTFSFTGISGTAKMYSVTAATGTDNGYIRTYDGNCAPWQKSAPGASHTPGVTNNAGGTSPYDGAVFTTQGFVVPVACVTQTSANFFYRVNTPTTYDGAATEGSVFPMTVTIFNDNSAPGGVFSTAPNGVYDPGVDVVQHQDTYASSAALTSNITKLVTDPSKFMDVIVLYTTSSGCYDKVFAYSISCATLPVDFKSFTATRNHSNVLLKWETSSENNNSGFAVERNMNGTWEQIAFVNSQAVNGNSNVLLGYTYSDLNNSKSITQYRIKQVDFDNKSKYTEIRSVRGLDQIGKVTVYPNPTSDGRVNVVFDDAAVTRNISVTDMSGRTIKQINNISNNNITIDNLMPGMYSLRIIVPATGEQLVQKIVVNKR
ncbi:MAG TPA: T9SS type A sorting domain-containing protein, partial [Chitinophagaceae bacterium]|nr:T9SS type A sorting domain-containing protein [Chitinophagaceae bacterium]